MKTILLVEDNIEISNNIKEYLELEWFNITQAFDWEEGFDLLKTNKFDLVLLDLMMPKIDWITISKKLSQKIDTPIIMITARDSINQKLEWFESWAIDYIIKPFDLRELEVRIKAHLKINKNHLIKFKSLVIDLNKREFLFDDNKIKITIKEFLIFEFLYNNKNKVVTRADIIEYVWWGEALFEVDWRLDVYISNIRKKLDKNIVETVKWIGYKYWW